MGAMSYPLYLIHQKVGYMYFNKCILTTFILR